MATKNEKLNKVLNGAKHYLVDTTGQLLVTPVYTAMEMFSGMSVETSLESRIKLTALCYGGLGIAYSKMRDFSRKVFKINKDTPERIQTLHDSLYNIAFNMPLALVLYGTSGADLEQTIKGTAGATLIGATFGPVNCYFLDTFRDFCGTIPTPRKTPSIIKNAKRRTKQVLAVGLVAAAVATTAGIYAVKNQYFSNNTDNTNVPEAKLEQRIEVNR